MSPRVPTRLLAVVGALALLAAACGSGDDGPEPAADGADTDGGDAGQQQADDEGELAGLLRLEPGECEDAGVTSGSYFRMVQSNGDLEEGPFVPNGDSPCGDGTFTPLRPGDDGGLLLGSYQPVPEPAFDDDENALASAIAQPQTWFAVGFGLSTNPVDPQTDVEVPAPRIVHDGQGSLSGDLSAFAASWNGQHFNQGSPKPSGELPGNTRAVTGTYDPETGEFTLEWSSQIVGGSFNNFTGTWHLEGVFEPAG